LESAQPIRLLLDLPIAQLLELGYRFFDALWNIAVRTKSEALCPTECLGDTSDAFWCCRMARQGKFRR
jgi:hypothetical protein